MACNEKVANLWAARVIPIILIGIVGYSTYVVVVRVCGAYHSCVPVVERPAILSALLPS